MNSLIKEVIDNWYNYSDHDKYCIRQYCEAGRPTENGGYEHKFKGIWYEGRPNDKTPKCDCGYDDAVAKIKELEAII